MKQITDIIVEKGADLFFGAVGAGLCWLIFHVVAKPILDVNTLRKKALELSEKYAHIPYYTFIEDAQAAKSALSEIGSMLMSQADSQGFFPQIYCSFRRFDLKIAAKIMYGIAQITGSGRVSDAARSDQVEALHCFLNTRRLSRIRKNQIRKSIVNEIS